MAGKRKRSSNKAHDAPSRSTHTPRPPRPPRQTPPKPLVDIYPQSQSLLFRLPRELRDIIYADIFTAPRTIHVAYVGGAKRRFRSFLCRSPSEEQVERIRPAGAELCHSCTLRILHYDCSPRDKRDGTRVRATTTREERQRARVGSMLRCCRRVYDETIETLYTSNEFYFENPRSLLELPRSTPQIRLSSFRHLYLQSPVWDGERGDEEILRRWGKVVRALEKMDGLQTLRVILRPLFGLTDERERLAKPLVEARLAVEPRILFAPFARMTPVVWADGGCCRAALSG
ncbi:uncharacterized protein BJX67DRAFT_379012 [Aspergillus lucknowensis]|uniref:DUF7730 domain-containing protein n=1 Tax=Aspergillus lucknowensis TaxID=176173 RepID=A0ABR4M1I1_9EURO